MTAIELINELKRGGVTPEKTCDTIKAGEPEKQLHRVAVSMFATVDVIRAAHEWGADMLITHEPTYYDHMDRIKDDPVSRAKKSMIEESGMVIFRYHDHMHFRDVDAITEGECYYLGLKGKIEKTPYAASYILNAEQPITAIGLARRIETELGVSQVRIAGDRYSEAMRIALCFGTPRGVFDLLRSEDIQMVITGEACEWQLCEYARDAAALGINKSVLVLGHIGSERDGMRLLAERMRKNYTEFETAYLECGEVYSYI